MGAGISSLSKICLVESFTQTPLDASGAGNLPIDIDYTFVGLGIENDEVDVAGNCGNMSSAIGLYAYNSGLLDAHFYNKRNEDVTGQAAVKGGYAIDGVAGTAAKFKLDFRDPYGSKTGRVFPTGNKVDRILGYSVTCVDGPNPAIFMHADDLDIDGTILPNDFNKLPAKLELLEKLRKAGAVAMHIAKSEDEVPRTIPKIGIIAQSSTHEILSGERVNMSELDLVVRFISDTQPHRAIPLTAALTTAIAARIPGTIVQELLAPTPAMKDAITIGHASGRIQVNATMNEKDTTIPISATVYRTARRIFEGEMFWIDNCHEQEETEGISNKDASEQHSLGWKFVKESRS
ncbi:DUF453-domain-containing protein [Lojkania enalia]|uniref:DUF453-domain-containing protein n=1 Tax=Lojkania enalia TaxID=147567 RepID=A0A9P4JVL7_9PLEO|nr:DUF453-domain-containing protein [Didymosphaeria enalia]